MPIDLNNLSADVAQKVATKLYSPKFFSNHLTGVGKKTGVLNQYKNPSNVITFGDLRKDNIDCEKKKVVNGNVESHFIPTNILPAVNGWDKMKTYTNKEVVNMTRIATKQNNTVNVYADICVHSLIHEIKNSADGGNSKNLHVCYQVFIYIKNDSGNDEFTLVVPTQILGTNNEYMYDYTNNPADYLLTIANLLSAKGFDVDQNEIINYVANYSLYDGVCVASEKWQTKEIFISLINEFLDNICKHYSISKGVQYAMMLMYRLENENVPLEFYKEIYNSIQKYFPADSAQICKMNMNLRLNNTLNALNTKKSQLFHVPTPIASIPLKQNPPFSPEQLEAVTTNEPLVLVQAGAGTGKSTVILGRIDYMVKCGVNPNDILVLSFTNAAANNILDRNPNVKSMTIASMIHEIYTANYSHELSSIETLMNSLDIYFDLRTDTIASEFYQVLKSIKKSAAIGFTILNNFVENNYTDVIRMLNTINQTSLELEIVICYQQIENFREPVNIQAKYLIIDEVQDNSVFEFVYTLKYVSKHNAGLFIVGDCSQTLYEFRASNPKALNVLEGSGVFQTYQLQVNYRSNQEILDFANVVLRDIEANQYAHIQLQANNLSPVTEQSFKDKVSLYYHQLPRMKDLKTSFPTIMMNKVKLYIDQKLAKNEQIAFLSYTRKQVDMIEDALREMYPDKEIASLVPEKTYNSTILSDFIKKYWDELQYVPNIWMDQIIIQSVYSHLQYLTKNLKQVTPIVQKMLGNWRDQNAELVHNWQIQTLQGTLTQEAFFKMLKENLLSFEIRHNAIRQHLVAQRNELNKKKQCVDTADFILSTIHSAKGLEFDNVVVMYKNDNRNMSEDKKRMYYVAFTRAMKSEFILAYDTQEHAKIEIDYNTILETLQQKSTIQAQVTAPPQTVQDVSQNTSHFPAVIPYVTQVVDLVDFNGISENVNYDFDMTTISLSCITDDEEGEFAQAQEFALSVMPDDATIIAPSDVTDVPQFIDPVPPIKDCDVPV